MPYDPMLVEPMRQEARNFGAEELMDANAVHGLLKDSDETVLVFVNSVCGCAAGGARPGLQLALQGGNKPDRVVTVFAGQDVEATQAAREYFAPYQPSSPQIGLIKNGSLVHMVQRHDIEGRMPQEIAKNLQTAFDEHCG